LLSNPHSNQTGINKSPSNEVITISDPTTYQQTGETRDPTLKDEEKTEDRFEQWQVPHMPVIANSNMYCSDQLPIHPKCLYKLCAVSGGRCQPLTDYHKTHWNGKTQPDCWLAQQKKERDGDYIGLFPIEEEK
jgi:hypothetical protein